MESIHSIIIIKKENKYLNYFDNRWNMYLFPNLKGNNIDTIKDYYQTDNVKLLFDKVHEKYSFPNKKIKTYHHYFYEVKEKVEGEYFTLEELLTLPNVEKYNSDIISFIEEYYNSLNKTNQKIKKHNRKENL